MLFLKHNFTILLFYFLNLAGVFSFVTILPTILKSHYGFSDADLSFGLTLFLASYTFSIMYFTNYMDKQIDVIKSMTILYMIECLSVASLISGIYFIEDSEVLLWIFFITRVFNGVCGGGLVTTTGYVLKLKLLRNKRNGMINSIIDSIFNSLKYIFPLLGAIMADSISPESPLMLGMVLIGLSLWVFLANKRKLFFHYTINFRKSSKKYQEKLLDSVKVYFNGSRDKVLRRYFVSMLVMRNAVRPFWDLYIPLALVGTHGYSITHTAFIISFVILGQILQFTTGKIIDKVRPCRYLLYSNMAMVVIVFVLIFNQQIYDNVMYLYMIMFVLGFCRSMYANYNYKMMNQIALGGVKLNHMNFINMFFGESGHYLSYLGYGMILVLGGGYDIIHQIILALVVLLMIGSVWEVFFMKKKYKSRG